MAIYLMCGFYKDCISFLLPYLIAVNFFLGATEIVFFSLGYIGDLADQKKLRAFVIKKSNH